MRKSTCPFNRHMYIHVLIVSECIYDFINVKTLHINIDFKIGLVTLFNTRLNNKKYYNNWWPT